MTDEESEVTIYESIATTSVRVERRMRPPKQLLCRCVLLQPARERLQFRDITPDRMVADPEICGILLSGRFPDPKLTN